MSNYAGLLEQANEIRTRVAAMSNPASETLVQAAQLLGTMSEALITLGAQNRHLRHDLALCQRDLDANMAELLKFACQAGPYPVSLNCEDESGKSVYMDFPDGLRIRFYDGRYDGWYSPGEAEGGEAE